MDTDTTNELLVRSMLEAIGDDPDRPGLLETPSRVVQSWRELFAGYSQDVGSVFKVFDESEKYDEMVIQRNIEFTSFCEHHMLPFYGHGHVAYIPNSNHAVIGASKLARILDIYARRLQMQERIGQQVVDALKKHLNPIAAACVLEAKHMCMACRGVRKQSSDMVTSSLYGKFKQDPAARLELFTLISMGRKN